MPYNRKANI